MTAKELKSILWEKRRDSEWIVKEVMAAEERAVKNRNKIIEIINLFIGDDGENGGWEKAMDELCKLANVEPFTDRLKTTGKTYGVKEFMDMLSERAKGEGE